MEKESGGRWQASAIARFNGQEATAFLAQFAAVNSLGYSNPDADWNNLMYSPAQDIQYLNNAWDGSSPFYPGDVYSLVFENGTTVASSYWLAVLNNPADAVSITSKEDFYDSFVVNSFDFSNSQRKKRDVSETSTRKPSRKCFNRKRQDAGASTTPNTWNNSAYPSDPVIAEADLGLEGVLSGYYLRQSLTAVLSIPNFQPGNVTSFSSAVGDFLKASTADGMQKIVIDLQQNPGGISLLATDVFQQVGS